VASANRPGIDHEWGRRRESIRWRVRRPVVVRDREFIGDDDFPGARFDSGRRQGPDARKTRRRG